MRTLLRLLPALACLAPALVHAQAALDQRALDQLGPAPNQPAPAPAHKPAPVPHPAPNPHAHPNGPHQKLKPLPEDIPAVPPAVPLAPPPAPVLPPPIVVPVRPPTPPTPPTVAPEAASAAVPTKDGMRVTFDSGSADLNPETVLAVRTLAKAPAGSTFTVTTYAAGVPDDPSTARRLALSRALAIRSLLIEQGIASMHIYLRALGSTGTQFADGPPDRADIVVAAPPPAPPAAANPPAPPSPAPSQKAVP